jgi:hypothetical protein
VNRAVVRPLAAGALVIGVLVGVSACDLLGPGPTSAPSAAVVVPTPSGAAASPSVPVASPEASDTPSALPSPTPEPTATPAPTPVLVAAPLTGVPVKPAVANRHVIAVMIDDQFDARPQSGLSRASVVWQAPAEGGIPRYMALFQDSDPPKLGPVRSSRLYFIAWASEWRSVYLHAGGSPQAMALLTSSQGRGKVVFNADALRGVGSRFTWRIHQRFAPHNVYTNAQNLRTLARRVGGRPVAHQAPVWRFAVDAPLEVRPQGGLLVVPYPANRITYRYDRKNNRYLRSVTGEGKQVDAGTKQRIAPKNVVVMSVRFGPLNDGSHKHRLEAQLIGSGPAWIATNGKTVKGTWKKSSFRSPTRFFGRDGKPVTLTIGQTFVQVVPRGTQLTIKDGKVPPAAAAFTVPGMLPA